ncbi:metalloregulator ArsR/SmtB family transcription factor [Mesorhizobium sp. M7A.F.Ca.US.008.03.1.1]|uniref:ArsR/SmtB family transcription factor n=1 Tax=Mesorhizobium sp. M7A.F.Ca.US.008.03.1.1 TaxID=2496742 RepID=UPI000FCC6042|nr:metalloregulator ArsR/SmtB family transcription factor [Mesorhizobium sp. M7A.F.Ca.US.008.03.1.1]RUW57536.1 ArsR family transcriptional regulator [Mesorhizobium sp. M7A.F.Ca.US.008.03.1.1]
MTSLQTATPSPRPIDGIFRALSDPTRRRVVERLNRSPASVSELAQPFDMALPSFIEHLKILEGCGLVRSQKAGRVRTYQLAPEPLKLAENWLAEQRALWERRLDQFDAYVMTLKEKEK